VSPAVDGNQHNAVAIERRRFEFRLSRRHGNTIEQQIRPTISRSVRSRCSLGSPRPLRLSFIRSHHRNHTKARVPGAAPFCKNTLNPMCISAKWT
jgi:hypothetical protein